MTDERDTPTERPSRRPWSSPRPPKIPGNGTTKTIAAAVASAVIAGGGSVVGSTQLMSYRIERTEHALDADRENLGEQSRELAKITNELTRISTEASDRARENERAHAMIDGHIERIDARLENMFGRRYRQEE